MSGASQRGATATIRIIWPAIALLVLLVAAVETAVAAGLVSALILPRPSEVVIALIDQFAEARIWEHIAATAFETVAGFGIGSGLAFVLAVLASMSSLLRRAVSPYVVALQVTPLVAVAPLIIAWLGFGYSSKIAIAALICFFPVYVNTAAGMLSADRTEEELFRSLGARRFQTLVRLQLPRALPTIFAGLKTAMTLALIGAVVGEFVSAERGLGVLVTRYSYQLAVASAFAVVIALTVLGLLLYLAMAGAERWVVFWRNDARLAGREARAQHRATTVVGAQEPPSPRRS
ncbi:MULTISPECIES: ABC transporter permease [unclassified Microbacterium]|uniref:ABC transporter permease n=1 Tax=unclassified Microbacterium TaxID=2609290 RepID=UPI00097F1783|nr:ABC transporter permease [Microbacterium sp. JB110]RCS57260.1 ABC transporter permease [Microbacterium sp. JB110]SJM58848.1 Hydroxymethylpyrimidine ABC transporter, transmembrane component [Frigoribacterium sp. JB110]